MTVCGADANHYNGSLTFASVVAGSAEWLIAVDTVLIGYVGYRWLTGIHSNCADGQQSPVVQQTLAVIDTGTSIVVGPVSLVARIQSAIGAQADANGDVSVCERTLQSKYICAVLH
jgi:hypothetical protein